MPGRVTTVTPVIKKTKASNKKSKRAQNALAIAEKQAPEPLRIRQNRLGQSESEVPKRKRQADEDDEEAELGNDRGNVSKRRRAGEKDRYGEEIEMGSDSSGNEWTVGQVNDDDDSDIDSDNAMAESDDDGAAIPGALAHASNKEQLSGITKAETMDDRTLDIDLREDVDQMESEEQDSDGFGDEAVDLAEILDDRDDGGETSESGSDDGATNSEAEEAKYGLSFSDEDDDAGNTEKLAALKALHASMGDQDPDSKKWKGPLDALDTDDPSDFGANPKRKLTVDRMLSLVNDPQSRKSLKARASIDAKSSSKRGAIAKKLEMPLPKRQQDRIDRAAAFEKSKETLNRWIDTVKHNRRAEHLSFPLKDPDSIAAQGSERLLPKSQSQPLNGLESTIQNILQESGLAAPSGKSEEDQLQAFEELKTRKMPLEEVEARRAQLRRARELLFREEIRSKRIKKIKSKTYRKVHRKERERNAQHEKDALAAAGIEDSEEEQERKDRRRAEERMGARHRDSRWAKGVKDSGRAKWDDDARSGVTEMARRNEELRRRIEGKSVVEDEEGDISSEVENDEDDDENDLVDGSAGNHTKDNSRLRRLEEHSNELELGAKGSKLASMDFMKNAEAARKARNNADVETMRRDLAGEETPSEAEDSEGPGRKSYGSVKTGSLPPPPKIEQKGELEERPPSDGEDDGGQDKTEDGEVDIVIDASTTTVRGQSIRKQPTKEKHKKRPFNESNSSAPEENQNSWLAPIKKSSNGGSKRAHDSNADAMPSINPNERVSATAQKPPPRSALKGARQAAQKPSQTISKFTPTPQVALSDSETSDAENTSNLLPFVLRNQKLVSQAFAGADVVTDFSQEKTSTIRDEDTKIIDNTLPGWGSWTGAGIGKKAEKRNRNKVLVKQPGIAKEKRKDAKLDRVIINEKRVKKNGVYLASQLPHPFETAQQYERSLRLPVGPEWATKLAVQDATKPRILKKQGIIAPMVKPIV